MLVKERAHDGTVAAAPDLLARLAAARAAVVAVGPLVADATAVYREALGVLADGLVAGRRRPPGLFEWDEAFMRFTSETGAAELRDALREVVAVLDLVDVPLNVAPVTRPGDMPGASCARVGMTRTPPVRDGAQ